jgi:hypothetical protein
MSEATKTALEIAVLNHVEGGCEEVTLGIRPKNLTEMGVRDAIIPTMASVLCSYCNSRSHMTIRWGRVDSGRRVTVAATCDNCDQLSVGTASGDLTAISSGTQVDISLATRAMDRLISWSEWWPRVGESPEFMDVPPAIAKAAKEAFSSATINNHMAAILMARTVVEATAKHKGILTGNLASKINALQDQNFIRPSIAEQAHEIRFLGNDMAHGDIEDAPIAADADETLALMSEVLQEVFQGPARMKRLRDKRLGQTQSS